MAFNIEKARKDGHSDQEIRSYLQKSGRSPDEVEALMKGHGETYAGISHYAKPAMEFGGMLGGQAIGGALGAMTSPLTGPLGPMAGRFMGGTAGNVVGGMGGDVLRSLMGTQPAKQIISDIPQEAKEGAQASALGEAIPGAMKGMGAIKRAISPSSGFTKGLGELSEAMTGQASSEFKQVAKDPRAILYRWMGGYPGASRTWNKFTDMAEKVFKIPKEALDFGRKETTSTIKKSIDQLMDIYEKIPAVMEKLKTQDIIKSIRGINKFLEAPPEGTVGYGEYKIFKGKLLSELEKRSDELAKAWKDVSKSQLAQSFHSPAFGLLAKIPGSGKAAGYRAFYEMRRLLPFIAGGGAGMAMGHPLEGALIAGGLSSPFMMGLPYAAAGAIGKAMESPAVVSGVSKAIQNIRKKEY